MTDILAYIAVCGLLSGAKGYGDAAFERAKHPMDLWHLVTRGALWLACVWPWLFDKPSDFAVAWPVTFTFYSWLWILIGGFVGIHGFWAGKRLGGKRWQSKYLPWLR